jgi:hypothetical protein
MKFFDYLYITTLVLLILKLLKITTISWYLVFMPIAIPFATAVILLTFLFMLALFK